ncbi:MAG TPA: nucleotidyltransferase family protein [Steroidobacteraceae bacterium]|nr:nucleotidyltransferase family protein [Steroidobacteraceae bacterium]
MRAMILAAGRGERMRPLTDTRPKPLLEVGDKPLIQYHIEALAAAGVRDIVINLAWQGELLRQALGSGERFGVQIHYSDEPQGALETGGGILAALPLLGSEPFLVVSGDIWSDFPLGACLGRLAPSDVAHFVLVPNPDFHEQGDFGLENGRVLDRAPRFTYANIALLRAEFFASRSAGRFPLAPLMFDWIRRGRVSGELYRGRWRNLGTPAQLTQLDSELRALRLGGV